MELTREQAIENHRKMWHWIADETEKREEKVIKEDYFKEHPELEVPYLNCYCCEYNIQNHRNFCNEKCIIAWSDDGCFYHCKSEYSKWVYENIDVLRAANLARQIANLPERSDQNERSTV